MKKDENWVWTDCRECIYFHEGDCKDTEGREGCYFGVTEDELKEDKQL